MKRKLIATFGLICLLLSQFVLADKVYEEVDWDVLVPENFRADAILDK